MSNSDYMIIISSIYHNLFIYLSFIMKVMLIYITRCLEFILTKNFLAIFYNKLKFAK